jgi:replicative DNA helicase
MVSGGAATLAPWQIAEQALLRAVLRDGALADRVPLTPEHFSSDAHAVIWRSAQHLRRAGKPVDPASVQVVLATYLADRPDDLRAAHGYVDRLYARPGDGSLEAALEHMTTVRTYAQVRQIAAGCAEVQRLAAANDMRALDALNALAADAAGGLTTETWRTWADVYDAMMAELTARQDGTRRGPVVTGIPSLDTMEAFQPGDYIILGARTSVGKSALALRMAATAAAAGDVVLYVSMEMRDTQLARRVLATRTKIPAQHLRTARLSEADWSHIVTERTAQAGWPLYIIDAGRRDIEAITLRARQQKLRTGLALVVVDYIQRLHMDVPRGLSRRDVLVSISSQLKDLATELDCVVLALAQVNRDGDTQETGRRPLLSDLKEAGALEEDADTVLLLSPETNGKNFHEWRDSDPRRTLLDVAKSRDGVTKDIHLLFFGATVRFEEAAA